MHITMKCENGGRKVKAEQYSILAFDFSGDFFYYTNIRSGGSVAIRIPTLIVFSAPLAPAVLPNVFLQP